MEKFSYKKIKQILNKIRPRNLSVVGEGVYRRLKKHIIKIEKENEIEIFRSVGRVKIAETGNLKMLIISHLTGLRISIKNMEKLKKKILENFLTYS